MLAQHLFALGFDALDLLALRENLRIAPLALNSGSSKLNCTETMSLNWEPRLA